MEASVNPTSSFRQERQASNTYISIAEYPQGKGMPLGESAPLSEGKFPERDSPVSQ